ncbi:MAG TPA: hypothetical protein VNO52_00345 [Methylomirabilota bacterium]|nr:hypothetical protein [Methylomirabilota bacterium]
MYPSSGATLRADINIKVEEASSADKFFIGERVMPPLPVTDKSGSYPKVKIAEGELLSPGSTVRERSGSYGRVSRNWTTDTYDCIDRGLEEPVDDTDQKDLARFFNLEVSAARWVLRNMKLDHEIRVKDATFNTTNYGAATNSIVAYTAANLATIDAPADILAAIDRVEDKGQVPNTILIPKAVFSRLALSTKLQNWVRGQLKGNAEMPVNAENIAASFADYGITQVLIGRARYNSAKKGQAPSAAQVWPNTYIWVGYVNPAARTPEDGGAGFTFVWNAEGGLWVSETYRDEQRRSNMVRVRQHTAEKVTDGTAGTLIATQYA